MLLDRELLLNVDGQGDSAECWTVEMSDASYYTASG